VATQGKLDGGLDFGDSDVVADFSKRFKNEEGSMFTQAFVNDCINIFQALKQKPKQQRRPQNVILSDGQLSNKEDDPLSKTQNSQSFSPAKRVNNVTFTSGGLRPPQKEGQEVKTAIESPRRRKKKRQRSQFDQISKEMDDRIIKIKQIIEASATSKESLARNQAMQAIASQIR